LPFGDIIDSGTGLSLVFAREPFRLEGLLGEHGTVVPLIEVFSSIVIVPVSIFKKEKKKVKFALPRTSMKQ